MVVAPVPFLVVAAAAVVLLDPPLDEVTVAVVEAGFVEVLWLLVVFSVAWLIVVLRWRAVPVARPELPTAPVPTAPVP